jgi:hypothetical protein
MVSTGQVRLITERERRSQTVNDEKTIRAKLAAMTDAEILVHYRREHGNPYMPLSVAKEMHRFAFKYLHDTLRAEARRKGIPLPEDDPAWQERIRQAQQRVAEHE